MREVLYIKYAEETDFPGIAMTYEENAKTEERENYGLMATKHIAGLMEAGYIDTFTPNESLYRDVLLRDKDGKWNKLFLANMEDTGDFKREPIDEWKFEPLTGVAEMVYKNTYFDCFRDVLKHVKAEKIIRSVDGDYYMMNNSGELLHLGCKEVYAKLLVELDGAENVFVVDFSFRPELFDQLIDVAAEKEVTLWWYDHHESALSGASDKMKALLGLREVGRSAAALVAEHTGFKDDVGVVKMVSDYDTYNFDDTDMINQDPPALNTAFGFLKESPDKMVERAEGVLWLNEGNLRIMINEGRKLLADKINEGVAVSKRGIVKKMGDLTYAMINLSHSSPGYACDPWYGKVDFAMTWFIDKNGTANVSLRSSKTGGANVADIAKKYRGGGHEHAAGFTLSFTEFYKEFFE